MKIPLILVFALTVAACGAGRSDCSYIVSGPEAGSMQSYECSSISVTYDSEANVTGFTLEGGFPLPNGSVELNVDLNGQLDAGTYDSTNTRSASLFISGLTLAERLGGTPSLTVSSPSAPSVQGTITRWPHGHGTFDAKLTYPIPASEVYDVSGKF
jgi:hypothetical protein